MVECSKKIDIRNYTLIVPSVSVGNVGQLTVDLLISSLNLKHLCYVWHPSIVPVAGSDPFGSSRIISTGCELFYSEKLRLAVMQIRSGILQTKNDFVQLLCKWVRAENIKNLIILTGSSAHERRDQQLIGKPVRFMFCPLMTATELHNASSRQWKEFETKETIENDTLLHRKIYIPGSGITVKLFKNCIKEEIPCSVLIEFCSDGNNAPDAIKLADYLNEWLRLKENYNIEQWVPPPSWVFMFGSSPPSEIFN